jgi:hypothetical protein
VWGQPRIRLLTLNTKWNISFDLRKSIRIHPVSARSGGARIHLYSTMNPLDYTHDTKHS